MSRSALHRLTGVHPNLVGVTAQRLIELGIVRDAAPRAAGRGRPSAMLEVDDSSRTALGIAIFPGIVELSVLNLRGHPLAEPRRSPFDSPAGMTRAGVGLLKRAVDERTLTIGVSVAGLVDAGTRTLLFSSAAPGTRDVSLQPFFDAANGRRIVLDNDQHAVAAWWTLEQRVDPSEDVILVSLRDGRLGASILAGGPPNRGCVLAANELGHTRLPIDTPLCFCGHRGCVERLFSSEYLQQLGSTRSLEDVLVSPGRDAKRLGTMLDHVAYAFANAVNLIRPHRLVLISPLANLDELTREIDARLRPRLLPALSERVRVESVAAPAGAESIAAGWLGLTSIFHPNWQAVS